MALARRKAAAAAQEAGTAAHGADVAPMWPTLVEFLTLLTWPEGEKRKTGTVMVLAEGGVWKAWVHDRDGARSGWVSAGSLYDLVNVLEDGLKEDTLTWRDDKPASRK